LLESQLFGHVRGAFTGALKDHWGKVKAAAGGTLFLDEIGDLPLEIQPKLLRLLQEREYERVGETVTRKADVRIVAATNRDLKQRVAEGLFREDLFYRLNVITVEMPPLRARPNDLLKFAEQAILLYSWPGNLRELRNAIERAVILAPKDKISAADLPAQVRGGPNLSGMGDEGPRIGSPLSLDQIEEAHIRGVLTHAPSLIEAAQTLGIDQATLYRKRKKYGMT
jgi:NtrC-family two-component system response regulator AlgB